MTAKPPPYPIETGEQYLDSLRGRELDVRLFGQRVSDPSGRAVFMDGEYELAATLVERFTFCRRRIYVCKSGV